MDTALIDPVNSFVDEGVGEDKLTIRSRTAIPDEHVSQLKRDKIDADHARMGEFVRFASIPIGVLELWDQQGYKIEEMSAREIVNKLRKEHLDAFVTTNKQVW